MTRTISVAETAKLVRTALKKSFPGMKFGVTSKSYSGGASIDVSWTDGPTAAEVNAVTKQFQGASFDAMEDLKSYHTSTLNGETIHFGADYIFANRSFSPAFIQRRADSIAYKWGCTVEMKMNERGGIDLLNGYDRPGNTGGQTIQDLVYRAAYRTRAPWPTK